jgi:hypothetical protein
VTQIDLHRVASEALASMQLLGKEHGVQKVEKAERVLNRSNQARRRSMSRIMPRWMKASEDSSLRS